MFQSDWFSGSKLFVKSWYRTWPIAGQAATSAIGVLGLGIIAVRRWNDLDSIILASIGATAFITVYLWWGLTRLHSRIRQELATRGDLTDAQGDPKRDAVVGAAARLLQNIGGGWNGVLILILTVYRNIPRH